MFLDHETYKSKYQLHSIDSHSPYRMMKPGIRVYQDQTGAFLPENQQPNSESNTYSFHISTRYKNIEMGCNGFAVIKDIKTGEKHETEKTLPELYSDRSQCCGCSACYSICPVRDYLENDGENSIGNFGEVYDLPHGAIYMEDDEEGFQYPVIDAYLCMRCYKCIDVCPMKNSKHSDVHRTKMCNEQETVKPTYENNANRNKTNLSPRNT